MFVSHVNLIFLINLDFWFYELICRASTPQALPWDHWWTPGAFNDPEGLPE